MICTSRRALKRKRIWTANGGGFHSYMNLLGGGFITLIFPTPLKYAFPGQNYHLFYPVRYSSSQRCYPQIPPPPRAYAHAAPALALSSSSSFLRAFSTISSRRLCSRACRSLRFCAHLPASAATGSAFAGSKDASREVRL